MGRLISGESQSFHMVIPGLPAQFAGRTRNPALGLTAYQSWIPGSIADEAGDGPGMTRFGAGFDAFLGLDANQGAA